MLGDLMSLTLVRGWVMGTAGEQELPQNLYPTHIFWVYKKHSQPLWASLCTKHCGEQFVSICLLSHRSIPPWQGLFLLLKRRNWELRKLRRHRYKMKLSPHRVCHPAKCAMATVLQIYWCIVVYLYVHHKCFEVARAEARKASWRR